MRFANFATFRKRFVALDERLDAWRDRHWPLLSVLGYALAFVLLSGGIAIHTYESGFAHAAAAKCGPPCSNTPGPAQVAAHVCGGAAIVFVWLYAKLAEAMQRVFVDPFKFVRPEPKSEALAGWAVFVHVLIGFVLFFAIAALGREQLPGEFKASWGEYGTYGFVIGWWAGGRAVLQFFWIWERRKPRAQPAARDARRKYEAALKARGIIDKR